MSEKNCVAFDLDDVLLDTESNLEWLNRSLWKTLEHYDIEVSEENLQKIRYKNLDRFYKMCGKFNIPPEELWKTRDNLYIKEKIKAIKNREILSFPDVKSLKKLKKKYILAIISDSPQKVVDFFVKEFGYESLFECVIGRGSKLEDLKKIKPSHYPFIKLIDNIQCDVTCYVGDREKDGEFAKNNDLEFILLNRENSEGFDSLKKVVDYLLLQ